jgi:flagellar biosynthetic protein FlhB
MAEDSFQDKTEQATPRRKEKAKEKGQVARSKDLTSMASMSGIIMILYFGGGYVVSKLAAITGGVLSMRYGSEPGHVSRIVIAQGFEILAPFFLVTVVLGVLVSVAQGGFVKKEMKFELDKLNPVKGIKNLFSMKSLSELLKSILKFSIGGWLVYYIINKDMKVLPTLAAMEMSEMLKVSGTMVLDAIVIAFAFFMVIAIFSYFLDKIQHERSLKMTKQEIIEEQKESDGDPMIKQRIRSIQRETARKRMMQEVPEATVVITNPQHLAVAIKYEEKDMAAPKIVAKGAGNLAARIREIATEHGIPIVENKPVARALYKQELNTFIPEELYVAVAKILAYIYKLKGKI